MRWYGRRTRTNKFITNRSTGNYAARLDSEKTVATVSTVVSLVCFNEWAHFLRRLSGSTNFTVAVEGIFGRLRGGAGWRAVTRDRQKEEGGLWSEMEYINTERRVEDVNRELTLFTRRGFFTKREITTTTTMVVRTKTTFNKKKA